MPTLRRIAGIVSLSWRLFSQTISVDFRKSFLGYFWMVAPALLVTGGVTLASRAGVINGGSGGLPYPLFAFAGILLWQVFADALDIGHKAFEGARSYITRVQFPREAIILAQLYEALLTASVRLALLLLLLAVLTGLDAGGAAIAALCFYGALLLGMGLGTILMPFTMLFADLHHAIKLLRTYGLFLTPALYMPQAGSLFSLLMDWNPVTPLMNAARQSAAGMPIADPASLCAVLAAAPVLAFAGLAFVRMVAPIVIERMPAAGR